MRASLFRPGCFAVFVGCCAAVPASAGVFGKDAPAPQWGLDAAKTPTPSYVGDASSVILFDEYVESGLSPEFDGCLAQGALNQQITLAKKWQGRYFVVEGIFR